MARVNTTIDGIVLYCDKSLDGFSLGRGYTIEKKYLDDISFKNRITDGSGRLTIDYLGSQKEDEEGRVFFFVYTKMILS